MKKLLLTLLLLFTLGLAANAAEVTLTLTQSNFSAGGYKAVNQSNVQDGLGFAALAYNSNGYQFNKDKGCFFMVSENNNGYVIKSITVTFANNNNSAKIKVYKSETAYSQQNESAVSGSTLVAEQTADQKSHTFDINAPYFGITNSGTKVLQMSSIAVIYEKIEEVPTECPVPVFSVENGANVYPGQTITVDKKRATTCELYLGEEKLEGDSYTVPETAEIGSTITLTAKSTLENGNPDNASATITVTVVETPLEALFDFENEAETTYGSWPNGSVTNDQRDLTHTIAGIILNATGRLTMFKGTTSGIKGGWGLRLYTPQGSANAGKITLTAPAGYYITSIEMYSDNFSNYGNTDNDVTVTSKEYEASSTTIVKSIKVTLAKIPEPDPELDGDVEIIVKHGTSAGVLNVKYTFSVANFVAEKHNVNVEILVDGHDLTFVKVEPQASAAPARANSASTVFTEERKAQHESLKGVATPIVTVRATLNGTELFSKTAEAKDITTTGIEDVTVDGSAEAEYYNLQGLRVAQPEAGQLYIKRQGGKAVKVRF